MEVEVICISKEAWKRIELTETRGAVDQLDP